MADKIKESSQPQCFRLVASSPEQQSLSPVRDSWRLLTRLGQVRFPCKSFKVVPITIPLYVVEERPLAFGVSSRGRTPTDAATTAAASARLRTVNNSEQWFWGVIGHSQSVSGLRSPVSIITQQPDSRQPATDTAHRVRSLIRYVPL